MSKSERTHLAAAAVPDLADGFLFGDTSSYELVILPVYVPGHYVLGIYDVSAATIHYYDSSSTPADHTSDAAEVYLKETVKRLNATYRPGTRAPRFYRHFDSAYAKQSDGTSCGFFVCYYAEAYLTLRQSTGFFMTDAQFINEYRRRVISVLLTVSTMMFPDYIPLTGFTDTYSRTQTQRTPVESSSTQRTRLAQASQFGMSVVAQIRQSSDTVPSAHSEPSTQSARLARVTKKAVASLATSMEFSPADTASFPSNLSPRAMFMYLRTAVAMYQLPVAVASPLLSLQKLFGKNAFRDVGLKLHKPPVETLYVLIPFPLREGHGAFVDVDNLSDVRWVLAIHAVDKNTTVIYDPTKTVRLEVLTAMEHILKKLVVTLRRQLLRTTTATSCSVADARTYSAFSAHNDSALGLLALAECYIAGSVKRLLFPDFAMDKFKNRVGGVFRQLHMKDDIFLKPLPGCRVVLASQQPPAMTADDNEGSANAPRRSTRVIRRSKKDNAAIFTRTNLTLLRPMNAINCNAHKGLGLGCAAQSVNHKVPVYTCGEFDKRCPHCDALLLASEVPRDGNQYTKCCGGGKVDTDYMREKYASLQDMPEPLSRYAEHVPTDPEAKNFHQNSKFYNSNMAFGSVTSNRLDPRDIPGRGVPPCRINGEMTHRLCDMYPNPERHEYEMWAQHFILDPADSLPKRLEHLRRQRNNPDYPSGGAIKPEIVDRLDRMLRAEHPFAAAYKKAHEVYEEAKLQAEREGKELPHFRLILLGNRDEAVDEAALMDDQGGRIHVHRVPEPREQNIAAIWVSDEGEPPRYYGAWLSGRKKGEFRKLDTLDPNLDPSLYPLLFPRGQQGYKQGIPLKDAAFTDQDQAEDDDDGVVERDMQGEPGSNSRNYISGRQHDRYVYAHRGSDVREPHWLHSKGRLAEFYTIDAANRRERHEFDMAQHFQEDRRLISAKEFVQAMENMLQRVHPGAKLGKMMHCKPTVKGSRAYMQRAFANAMTIFDRKGKPALFVTFTGNPQWPEIQALLNTSTDTWLNHPQEVVRIFADKAYEFLTDILKRDVLGKVVAYAISTELQMRGMPHLHCLFTLDEDTPGLGEATYVDEYISAELPDLPEDWKSTSEGRRQKRLYDSVVKFNVHDCNDWCLVGNPPRCNKRFPKPYSVETIVSPGHYVQYERRAPRELYDAPSSDDETDDGYYAPGELPPASAAPRRRPPVPPGLVDPADPHNYGNVCIKQRGNVQIVLDNSHVVPYNPFLTEKYQTHINVEYCQGTACVSYALKYIMKGHTLAFVTTEQVDADGNQIVDYNEFAQIQRCVYRSSAECALRTQGFPVVKLSHVVVELPVHGPGEESLAFVEGQEHAALDDLRSGKKRSKLMAFFDMCNEYLEENGGRMDLLYCDVGMSHWFNYKKNARCW
ncbi:hypothetical protein AAVH_29542, partial [Aphelenchoides avenae]